MSMYAKLMSRITESSLMDEEVIVRYSFIMMLAIADPQGYVVGTDVAIARRMNIPLETFKKCLVSLMAPDENSNSKEHEGRRVIDSDCERGYYLVNYRKYRDTRDEEHRREYMREYMRNRRNGRDVTPVNNGKQCKLPLAKAEGEVEVKVEGEGKAEAFPQKPPATPKPKIDNCPTTDTSKRIADIFKRRHSTPWTEKEIAAFKKLGVIEEEDLRAVERYYASNCEFLRHDLGTFLNNFFGEVDRARKFTTKAATEIPRNQVIPKAPICH